jgi:hypothetical protein
MSRLYSVARRPTKGAASVRKDAHRQKVVRASRSKRQDGDALGVGPASGGSTVAVDQDAQAQGYEAVGGKLTGRVQMRNACSDQGMRKSGFGKVRVA